MKFKISENATYKSTFYFEGDGDGPLLKKKTKDLGAVSAPETGKETLLEQRTHYCKGEVHATDTTVEPEPRKIVEAQEKTYRSVGDYSVWKTSLSDQFRSLTDDEVIVLYSFLCADYGTPDFTNEEWFDILKEIRLRLYRKPVPCNWTQEDAQQTLETLKSSGFVNVNQQGIHITDEVADEVMYCIAKRTISYDNVVFKLSNFVTSKKYLRTQGYIRKTGEKCILGVDTSCDSLLIRRLQMDVLIHDTMEDATIFDQIFARLNIPKDISKASKEKREEFLKDLEEKGHTVHHRGGSQNCVLQVKWLWEYGRPDILKSCIGLHPHWDIYIIKNKAYRKPSTYHGLSPEARSLLYSILLADDYTLNVDDRSALNNIRKRFFPEYNSFNDFSTVTLPDKILQNDKGRLTFTSENVRHDVMYAFVTECLLVDSDMEVFLTTASCPLISEFCRSWAYQKEEGERCVYIHVPNRGSPEKRVDLFLDRLDLDIIAHCTMSDWGIHSRVAKRFEVPAEILKWDQEARKRYVEYAKRGTQTVHHARGMIVGCAGAGKTTLLKRLLGRSEEEIRNVTSTEGLEVHEEIFEIRKGKLIEKSMNEGYTNVSLEGSLRLSFFDFGGQCAYYACHQIYLTRRAFYIVVIDASKKMDEEVDSQVCDQTGSVFSAWTYGEYFAFWIKSIHTYCSKEYEGDPKPVVLIVASHWEEESRQYKDTDAFMECLQEQFPASSNLSQYVTEGNCYFIQFSVSLNKLEKRLVGIASDERWTENIPKEWAFFEIELNQTKHSQRILDVLKLTTKLPENVNTEQQHTIDKMKSTRDMLRFYHDAGKVLYFNELGLKESVIIDVQWFIDAFKHIITDKLHLKGIPMPKREWKEYYETGHLQEGLLVEIWKNKDDDLYEKLKGKDIKYKIRGGSYGKDPRYLLYHKKLLLQFMQRLGLLAISEPSYYVPCMNRKEMEKEIPDLIKKSGNKSSVLIYRFTFLPYFLFFRLVVACMQVETWKVLKSNDTPCLYRDVALFSSDGYNIIISVTAVSIQLQVFQTETGRVLEKEKTFDIQKKIEGVLNDITGTFHRKLSFVRGFRCKEDNERSIAMDIEGHFLPEDEIPKEEKPICPLHSITDRHSLNKNELTKYWLHH